MGINGLFGKSSASFGGLSTSINGNPRLFRQLLIGIILILALFAFEMFNFDTTRYALQNLMGDVRFMGLAWATILAVAFCAIDFAGLARLFTPERGLNEPKEVWYLTGAWLLGATMNAVMTWWAVSLVLVEHPIGNEVLSRDQLLNVVPVFVAVLVWLTRILFIGAVTLAGERLIHGDGQLRPRPQPAKSEPVTRPSAASPQVKYQAKQTTSSRPANGSIDLAAPQPLSQQPTRVNRRPPRPGNSGPIKRQYGNVSASSRPR